MEPPVAMASFMAATAAAPDDLMTVTPVTLATPFEGL